jgi:hypothetical protein
LSSSVKASPTAFNGLHGENLFSPNATAEDVVLNREKHSINKKMHIGACLRGPIRVSISFPTFPPIPHPLRIPVKLNHPVWLQTDHVF